MKTTGLHPLCYLSALLLLPFAQPSPALAKLACAAQPSPAKHATTDPAEALMAAIESNFRRGARIVRMDIHTTQQGQRKSGPLQPLKPSQKTLWGVFHSDATRTDLLYVFSGPGRLAGTTLLMHDYANIETEDSMWLYLRSFEIFMKIDPTTQRVLVPGTALSYEDSRGFIPRDKFLFSTTQPPQNSTDADTAWILACPRSETIAKNLGYSSLLLQVDPKKRLVLQVKYSDLYGRPLKAYQLLEQIDLGDRNFPSEVQLQHFTEGFLTTIGYEYWLPEKMPPASLYAPDTESENFIERLNAYLSTVGLGERIASEIKKADEQLQEFVDRLNKMKGGKAATSGISKPQ
jgi:hypothetical protein